MNFKSILILLVFTFISTSDLCNADLNLDGAFEGLEIYEELDNLTKTNEERGTNMPIMVNITATYTCKDSIFANISSVDHFGGGAVVPFTNTIRGLSCTGLTKTTETAFYRGFEKVGGRIQNFGTYGLRTVMLRVNGKEICTQTGTLTGDSVCNGAKVFLYDTITQSANADCNSPAGLTDQTTSTAVLIITKKSGCESKCNGQITYKYTPGLR